MRLLYLYYNLLRFGSVAKCNKMVVIFTEGREQLQEIVGANLAVEKKPQHKTKPVYRLLIDPKLGGEALASNTNSLEFI